MTPAWSMAARMRRTSPPGSTTSACWCRRPTGRRVLLERGDWITAPRSAPSFSSPCHEFKREAAAALSPGIGCTGIGQAASTMAADYLQRRGDISSLPYSTSHSTSFPIVVPAVDGARGTRYVVAGHCPGQPRLRQAREGIGGRRRRGGRDDWCVALQLRAGGSALKASPVCGAPAATACEQTLTVTTAAGRPSPDKMRNTPSVGT